MSKASSALLWVLLSGSPAAGQVIVGRVIDESWLHPMAGVQVSLEGGAELVGGAVTDSSGRFRIVRPTPGQFMLRVATFCMIPVERPIVVPVDSSIVDVGTLILAHARPRPRLNHQVCRATRTEDAETRAMVHALEENPEWRSLGETVDSAIPVSSEWIQWGEPVTVFGVSRPVLSPFNVGGHGLMGAPPTYAGPFLSVDRWDGPGYWLLTATVWRVGQGARQLSARLRPSGSGWSVSAVAVRTVDGGGGSDQ